MAREAEGRICFTDAVGCRALEGSTIFKKVPEGSRRLWNYGGFLYSRGLQRAPSSRSQRALERCHGLPEDFEKAFGCSEVLPTAIAGSRKFGNDAGGSQ